MKEHVPKYVTNFIKGKTNMKTAALLNATRRSSMSENLVNKLEFGNNHGGVRFKIVQQCSNVYYLIKMEPTFVYLNNPELCKQKKHD